MSPMCHRPAEDRPHFLRCLPSSALPGGMTSDTSVCGRVIKRQVGPATMNAWVRLAEEIGPMRLCPDCVDALVARLEKATWRDGPVA